MAEAVRPRRKKKKAKQRQVIAEEDLQVLQSQQIENEQDVRASVKEENKALDVTSDDLTAKQLASVAIEIEEHGIVALTVESLEHNKCKNDESDMLDLPFSVLGEVRSEDEHYTELQTTAEISEGCRGKSQVDDMNSKHAASLDPENVDIRDGKEVGDSVEDNRQTNFIVDEDTQGHLGSVGLQENTTDPFTFGNDEMSNKVGLLGNMCDESNVAEDGDTKYSEGQLGIYESNVDTGVKHCISDGDTEGIMGQLETNDTIRDPIKDNQVGSRVNIVSDIENNKDSEGLCEISDQDPVDDLGYVGKDVDDKSRPEGQIKIENLSSEGVSASVMEIRDTQNIGEVAGAIKGSHEEPMDNISHPEVPASASFFQESISSADASGIIGEVNKEKNLYGHIYNLFGKQQVSLATRETVTAFTEDDLKSFYYNPQLAYIEEYVEDFIKETLEPRRESEFYELLNTYQNSSKNLRNVEVDIEILQKKCQDERKTVWSSEMQTVTVQGTCNDQQKVSHTHTYQVASFNQEQATKVSRTLDIIKNLIHETFTLAKYSCQLARIHITSYIYELHAQSPVFCGINEDSPVIGNVPSQVSHVVLGEIQHLRDCVNALCIFVRRPTEDEGFYNDVNSWLQCLVALLLRVASLPDHVYLLNHVLRCPPGVTRKLAHFIQPLLFSNYQVDDDYVWHSPLLHHFVSMLATLLFPIRFREKYLIKMKALLTPDGSDSQKTISWVIIDEDGEEDENPEETWMLIPENDLVALFLQFPFDELFKKITGIPVYHVTDVDSEVLGMDRKTSTNVMQVFAFSTCLIQMLGKAFSLYSMTRYREFVKRLGRAIRTIVMHVSRYWSAYMNHYLKKYGKNETTFQLAFGSDYSLEKLQLEYDHLFIGALQQIFSAHKLGAWQFLIDMPFQSLSSKMLWICYRFLHKDMSDKDVVAIPDCVSSHSDRLNVNDTSNLMEHFKSMTEAEVVFLLTTFANMAQARSPEDKDFISAVVLEIYELSYVNSDVPDFLPKTGKDLLSSISSSHSFVMSLLLERIGETLDTVKEESVTLFQALPVATWRPKMRDIQTIRNWLLRSTVDSPEHQLSRYLLTNLNWQYQDSGSDVLYLPRCVHRAVAILLVETCALRLSNRPGGIAVDVFKETPGILEQVTQMATAPYQRIIQHYSDQDLYKWLWDVVMSLHLHEAECPVNITGFTDSPTSQHEAIATSYDRSDFFKTLSKPQPLDLDSDEVLVNVLTSANKDGPFACYVALQLSSYGHNPELFGHYGLSYVSTILDEGHVFPTCRIIANIIPTFFTRDLLGLSQNSRFATIINTIIHSDAHWRDQGVLEIMSAVIQRHVQKSGVLPDTDRTLIALEFWLKTLCYIPNWNKDTNVLYLLNNLLKCAFRNSDAHEMVMQYFCKKHEDTLKSLQEHGFLSSLFSFLTSNPSQANLVDIKTLSSYSYYCFYVLSAESDCQKESGLKFALANKLHDKPDMCIETALKKVTSSMKDMIPIPSCNLDVYRWADLALSIDHDHPILAIVWQKFFTQFLQRVPVRQGIPERGSVGLRYFESTTNTTYLKRLKARLMGTVEHHRALSTTRSETNADNDKYETPARLHERLAKVFQTLALWLDEPRIHDPTLYLQGLPSAYDSQRLTKILKSDESLWMDCVDIGMIDWEFHASGQCWLKFNNERQKKITAMQNRHLINRVPSQVKSLDDIAPPPLFKILSTPLPEFPISVLLDRQKIMETLGNNLHVLAEHARKFTMKFSTNSALDFEYVDMLEHMFENAETEIRVTIPCQKKSSTKKVCLGAAEIVLKFREKKTNDLIIQRATQNREEYDVLIREMLQEMPTDLCVNALCVEKSLTLLLKQWKTCQNPGLVNKFENIGCNVFFMFVEMVSDGVRRFPPTMQFFSTCIELLGKAFIMENKQQTEVLLRTILAHPNIVGLLLPIFQPATSSDTFIEMYENVIQTSLDVEVKFSLLSKFDFRSWLTSKPILSERFTMMKVLFAALCDCGFEPPVKTTMLSEIYIRKVNVLLLNQFPDLFGETLRLLIDGSADHTLCMTCWIEFLITTKIVIKNKTNRELELNTAPPFLLQQDQVTETMAWLMEYYNDQRSSCSPNSTEGLFTLWKPYLMPLSALYEYVSRQSIAACEDQLASNDIEVITSMWRSICNFFSPWIFSMEISSNLASPWSEYEVDEASEFVDLYVRVIMYFQTFLPVPSVGQPNILSLLWEHYTLMLTNDTLPGLVLRVYHAKFLSFPWDVFYPTVSYLESMLKICAENGNCRSFLGCIFPRIPWHLVMKSFRTSENVELLRQFQLCFFRLLLVLGNDKFIVKKEESKMLSLLENAEKFDWDLIDANTYGSVCNWLVSNGDLVEVLEPSSAVWCSLGLLKAAALFSDPIPAFHAYVSVHRLTWMNGFIEGFFCYYCYVIKAINLFSKEIQEKRLHYLNCVVSSLCKCSSSPRHSPGLYRPVIEQLMDNVLAAADSGETIARDNITAQYMGILNLLNKLSPSEKVLDVALQTLQDKIRDLTGRTMILSMIAAACRSLAGVSLMVQIVEFAAETHFSNIQPMADSGRKHEENLESPWSDILGTLAVPELSQREFVQECINHDAVLTLFAHVVQCLSQCQSAAYELSILKDLITWSASIKPCNPDTETKVILLWYKILQLFVRQVNCGMNLRDLGQQVDFLIPLIAHVGGDRDTSGLLGVIGLGRKSTLSVSFRFLCRALSTFLLAQLPSNGIPRVKANCPGVVKVGKVNPKKEISAGIIVQATLRATLAFSNLEGLRSNKTYSGLTGDIEYSCQFIADPAHSLCDGPEFLEKLTKELFKDKSYLDAVV